jgi:hypothetical protein
MNAIEQLMFAKIVESEKKPYKNTGSWLWFKLMLILSVITIILYLLGI